MTRFKPAVTPAEIGARDAARDAKLDALHTTLTQQITALRNGQDWQNWLRVAARFHNYSFNNVILIAAACSTAGRPPATAVAGFGAWQALGRQVNKGERGIQILAPLVRRPASSDTSPGGTSRNTDTRRDSRSASPSSDAEPIAEPGRVAGWRVVHVFDILQTSGEPLPERPMPQLLAGQAPDGLWKALAEQVTAHGFALQRGDCGTANGLTDYTRRTVRVRTDIDDAAAVKTLSHDLLTAPTPRFVRSWQGVAQGTRRPCSPSLSCGSCTAGLVASDSRGVTMEFNEASGYTFAYVAGWAGPDLSLVRQAAETVTKAARTILDHCSADAATGSDDLADTA